MTARERFLAIMNFEACDRSLDWESGIWFSAVEDWLKEGMPHQNGEPETINVTGKIYFALLDSFLGLDETAKGIPVNYKFLPPFPYKVFEENEEYMLVQDEWGIKMKIARSGDAMPHFIDYPVKTQKDFDALKERFDTRLIERYPQDWNKLVEEYNERTYPLFANDYPYGMFGFAREIMGAEGLLYAMYDDPSLIKDIMNFTADFLIRVWEKAICEAKPDFFRIWEDMCYRNGPLISPAMFREFMLEPYKKITDFVKSCGCNHILVDTDGDCSALIALFVEGGATGLYPFECASGMDVVKVREEYPKLSMMGGIDKMALMRGKEAIDAELDYKVRRIIAKGGFIPHVDHFVPPGISWEDFLYYRLRMKEILYSIPVCP